MGQYCHAQLCFDMLALTCVLQSFLHLRLTGHIGGSNQTPACSEICKKAVALPSLSGGAANENFVIVHAPVPHLQGRRKSQCMHRLHTDSVENVQEVDQAVNEYPCERIFTAIGDATPGFKDNMIACVEKALNFKVHPESILERQSSGSKYISIKIGPVIVSNADEVVAVYTAMKKDERLKWFI